MNALESFDAVPTTSSMKPKYRSGKCVICGSLANQYPTRTFHKFPPDPQLSEKWAIASGKKYVISANVNARISRYRICEKHFLDEDYCSDRKKRLKPDVVPLESVSASTFQQLKHKLKESMKEVDQMDDQSPIPFSKEVPPSSSHSTFEEPSLPPSFATDEDSPEIVVAELIIPKKRNKNKGGKCVFCEIYRSQCPGPKYHRFPKNPKMSEKWALACGKKWVFSASANERYVRYRVCDKHFSDEDYKSGCKGRLKPEAVPCGDVVAPRLQLSLMKDRLKESIRNEDQLEDDMTVPSTYELPSLPTPSSTTGDETTSNFSKLKTKYPIPESWQIRNMITNPFCLKKFFVKRPDQCDIQNVLETVKGLVSPVMYDFISDQLKYASVSKYRRRWSVGNRNLTLSIYLASREAYKFLSKVFYMPSKTRLLQWLSDSKMNVGFSTAVLNSMKLVACGLKPHDKLCIVTFGMMKLCREKDILENFGSYTVSNPSLATHALVFIVRGLCRKWKQVFGYFFSGESLTSNILKHLLNEALTKLVGCGFVPMAVVCDHGENNQQLYKKDLGISPEKPYFFFQDHKIYCLTDAYHLLNCIRNSFKLYPAAFTYKGVRQTAFWEHIVKSCEFDCKISESIPVYLRNTLHKITRRHVEIERLSPMNLRMAAETLCRPVAGLLCFVNAVDQLPSAAIKTADFCAMLGDLFESVSGKKLKCRDHPLLASVSWASPHLKSWKESAKFIESIQFQTEGVESSDTDFSFLLGWLTNLSAFRMMIPELLNVIPHVIMCRFTIDALKNVFLVLRRKSGPPTPTDFTNRIEMLMARQIINLFGNAKCEPNEDTNFIDVQLLAD